MQVNFSHDKNNNQKFKASEPAKKETTTATPMNNDSQMICVENVFHGNREKMKINAVSCERWKTPDQSTNRHTQK